MDEICREVYPLMPTPAVVAGSQIFSCIDINDYRKGAM